MDCLSDKDFVFTKNKNGRLESGGYAVDTILLTSSMNASDTDNNKKMKGGNNMNIFKDLAVPAPFLCVNRNDNEKYNVDNAMIGGVLDNDIYDQLLRYVSPDNMDSVIKKTKINKTKKSTSSNLKKSRSKTQKNKTLIV